MSDRNANLLACPECGDDNPQYLTLWEGNQDALQCGKCQHRGSFKDFSKPDDNSTKNKEEKT